MTLSEAGVLLGPHRLHKSAKLETAGQVLVVVTHLICINPTPEPAILRDPPYIFTEICKLFSVIVI